MNRGKGASRRGPHTLAWYIDDKILDEKNVQNSNNRRGSSDSQRSNANNQNVDAAEERRRRERRHRLRQRGPPPQQQPYRSQQTQEVRPLIADIKEAAREPTPEPVAEKRQSADAGVAASVQQQLTVMTKDRENYWYYDQTSDGFYYEHNGSRGWRKRNQELHGDPPLTTTTTSHVKAPQKLFEEYDGTTTTETTTTTTSSTHGGGATVRQTIEKKIYVPVPVFTSAAVGKYLAASNTSNVAGPGIKYYDPSTDGYFFEMGSVDGWRKRQPAVNHNVAPAPNPYALQNHHQQAPAQQPDMLGYFIKNRDLTNQEVEDLVLSQSGDLDFAQLLSRQISKNAASQTSAAVTTNPTEEYPSSSSTVSSAQSDGLTPPPPRSLLLGDGGTKPARETTDAPIGSFEEPYEFYWSDSERTDRGLEQASSVSSVDEMLANPLTAYFNGITLGNKTSTKKEVKRPSSLKIAPQPQKTLPHFNVDQFIADLPGNRNHDSFLNAMSTPISMDTPYSGEVPYLKESPMFTAEVNPAWQDTKKRDADSRAINFHMLDLEKYWAP